MTIVRTKDELKKAIEHKEQQIEIVGPLAVGMVKKSKFKKKVGVGSALLAVGGLVAAPFTGGASLIVTGAGAVAMSGGTIAIITAIVAITGLSLYAIKKDYSVVIENENSASGHTKVSLNRK